MAKNPRRNGVKRTRKNQDLEDVSSGSDYVPNSDSDFAAGAASDDEMVELDAIPVQAPSRSRPTSKKRKNAKNKEVKSKQQWKIWEEENKKWVDDHLCDETDSEDGPRSEIVSPSLDVILPLLRFQKEWLAWALKQEDSVVRGGILADEMGMGKTIQAISLVLTARSLRSPVLESSASSSCSLPRTKATLVICPVVAVIQWVGEIDRYTESGSVRVLVYHGPKRSSSVYDFNDYDFVLTTYQTIEWDYRKHIMPPKLKCEYCKKWLANEAKMRTHLKYWCGPTAQLTEKQAKQEKKKKKKNVHSAKSKKEEYFRLEDEKGKGKKVDEPNDVPVERSQGKSWLHTVKWERIILDEAHFIKDRRSNTARAVFALDSVYRWALSGTPLQNRVGELYSLVRFLQVYPYSYYFCKDCDCRILDYTVTGDCGGCDHANVRHFCWWNRYINRPIQNAKIFNDEGRRAMILLKNRLLKSLVLRRTKKSRAADLALPPRMVTLRRDSLDRNEQEFYEALYTQSRVQFDTYVGAGTLMNNYAHIFELLTRLRQAVDHPYLVIYSRTAPVPDGGKEENVAGDCGICHDPAEDAVVTSCDHTFCKACLIDYSATLGDVSCPLCSKPLTVDLTTNNISGGKNLASAMKGYKRSGILSRLKLTDFKTSTKIDALREEIRCMVEGDGSAKGIVFSQFTSFLDLINFSLQMSGVKCVQLVGSMSLAEREKAINTFTEDGDCRIFLMSLKAGGVALNLTVASHVFLMDPWWNPAVEHQAQDRIHRIGQYKPIRIVRFVIEDTIEERILKLQEKKELVFEGTVGDSKDAMAKLTEEDLRFLFQI